MKTIFISFLAFCSFYTVSAQDSEKVKDLEQRVQKLEQRLAKLEKVVNSQQTPEVTKMRRIAREHSEAERNSFKAEDIAKAEELYQRAAKILSDSASKPLLDSVVSIYPQLNRAGCAQLYRAQQENGKEKERLLKDCIERFSNCYYFHGAQVGALAMFQLAFYYRHSGKEDEARKLFKRLRKENPEAVGHDGALLVEEFE